MVMRGRCKTALIACRPKGPGRQGFAPHSGFTLSYARHGPWIGGASSLSDLVAPASRRRLHACLEWQDGPLGVARPSGQEAEGRGAAPNTSRPWPGRADRMPVRGMHRAGRAQPQGSRPQGAVRAIALFALSTPYHQQSRPFERLRRDKPQGASHTKKGRRANTIPPPVGSAACYTCVRQ